MNEKLKKILTYIIIGIVIICVISVCIVSIRYNRKFKNLERAIDDSRSTAAELRVTVGQQESIVKSITERQSELEALTGRLEVDLQQTRELVNRATDTLNNLISVEQNVDGYAGAIRGTVDQVSRVIDITIEGISSEGVTD